MGLVLLWIGGGVLFGQGPDPGGALRFDGSVATARVGSDAGLNSYPLTVTAWVRTTDTAFTARGIVSKYNDASSNGWSILLSEGVIHGWYFRDGLNFVFTPSLGLNSGFVADGAWHHVALVVDAAGGRLYVDGRLPGPLSSLGWATVNGPGATTSPAPLQIGYYHNYPNSLDGEIDEVTVWSVAKSGAEIRELRRAPPVGSEPDLVAYWKFDDGAGTTVSDATANGRDLSFVNTPEWVESTLMFGSRIDVSVPGIGDLFPDNIIASDTANPDPAYTREGVNATASLGFRRVAGGPAETVAFEAVFRLLDQSDQAVPLEGGVDEVAVPLSLTFGASGGPDPVQLRSPKAVLTPAPPLDPGPVHRVQVIVRREDPGAPGAFIDQARRANDGFQYWQFTGTESGDAADNVLGRIDTVTIPQRVVIGSGLAIEVPLTVRRYDGFAEPLPGQKPFTFTLTPRLIDVTDGGAEIPLASDPGIVVIDLPSFVEGDPRLPSEATRTGEIALRPTAPLPAGHDFEIVVEASWIDGDGSVRTFSGVSDTGPLTALSGRLFFDQIETVFTALNALPFDDGMGNTVLDIAAAHVAGFESHTFSGPVTVSIDPVTLDATVIAGSVNVTAPVPDVGAAAGVRIERGPIVLDAAGGTAPVTVWFPAGFGVATPTNLAEDPAEALWPKAQAGVQTLDTMLAPLGGPVPFDADAVRLANAPLAPGETLSGPLFAFHEKFACWLEVDVIHWDPSAGTFTLPPAPASWVREDEMASLPPGDGDHPSNDQFLAGAVGTAGQPVVIGTSPAGVALLNATIALADAEVRPHFPGGSAFAFTSGQIVFFDNALDPSQSALDGVTQVTLEYSRNCADGIPCPETTAPAATLTHTPDSASLFVTSDLGLVANGFVAPGAFQFGTADRQGPGGSYRFAHQAEGFSAAVYHQAGIALDGMVTAASNDDRPGILLLSGHRSFADPALVERPGGPGYGDGRETDGQANYPGLNFRVAEEGGAPSGAALISGQSIGPFPLTGRSKYYIRPSGVSGIHERVTTGTALSLRLYGFDSRLDYFKLSYLSNENRDSVCDGGVTVPWPAGFQQEFLDLRFTCRGQPSAARLPADGNLKQLEYWGHADFEPLSLAFSAPKPVFGCADVPGQGEGFLLLGVRMLNLPLIAAPDRPLLGSLGFKREGALGMLVTKADQGPGGVARGTSTDSRLDLPASLRIIPPPNGQLLPSGGYPFIPATKGYFNTPPAGQTSGTDGFVSFAGKLALPFFEEAKVHVHAIPAEGRSGVRFMGGWPTSDVPGSGEGWADAQGRTFFTHPEAFDAGHVGHPGNLASYRDPGASTVFRPRARKNWLDLVTFDYPLEWEKDRQRFRSLPEPKSKFLVLELENRLRFMNADGAEIVMGISGGLPELNAQQLVLSGVDAAAGGFFSDLDRAIDEAIAGGLTSAADAVKLTDAAAALDELLGDKLAPLADDPFNALLDQIVDPVVAGFYPPGQQPTGQLAALRTALCGNPGDLNNQGIIGTTKWVERMVKESADQNLRFKIRTAVATARDGATSLRDMVKRYPVSETESRRRIVSRLIEVIAKGVVGVSSVPDTVKNKAREYIDDQKFVREIEDHPAWDEIERQATSLAGQLDRTLTSLQDGGAFDTDLDTLADSLEATQLNAAIRDAVRRSLDLQEALGGSLAEHSPDQLRTRIKDEVRDRFYASFAPEDLQFVFRARLGSERGLFRQLLDDVVAEMVATAREAIRRAAVDLAADVPFLREASGFVGFPGDSATAIAVKGYGRIIGNSMSEARIDGQFNLGLPDKSALSFDGFVLIRDLQVTGPAPNCGVPGAVPGAKSEVTMGAKLGARSKSGGFAADMQIGLDAQFAFDAGGDPLGFLGRAQLKPGPAGRFGKTSLNEVTLELAWVPGGGGVPPNRYLKGIVDGVVDGIGAKVRVFAGETCDIIQLGVLDKYMEGAMRGIAQLDYPEGAPIKQVAGVYVSTDGQFPLEKIIGLPADNPLISAIAKGGWSWFVLVPGGAPIDPFDPNLCVGYRQSFGVDVKALILLEASLEMGAAGIACVSSGFLGVPPDLAAVRAAVYGRGEVCVGVDLLIKKFKVCAGLEVTGTLHGTDVEITGASF